MNAADDHMANLNPTVLRSRLRCSKNIAGSPHGVDQFFDRSDVQLLPEATYKDINDIRLGIKIVPPQVCQDHRLRYDPRGVAHQIFKKSKFPRLEVNLSATSQDLALEQVYRQSPKKKTSRFDGTASATHQRLHSR